MKVVLETNVLVSGMIRPTGVPGRIVDMIRAGVLQLVVDDRILLEYADVLRRPTVQPYFSAKDADAILEFLEHSSEHALATVCIADLPDPDDAPCIEVALVANTPLVTGNTRHFPPRSRKGCLVMTPNEFIARYQANVTTESD